MTERYLSKLFREAVLSIRGSCIFCGNSDIRTLEAHHIKHRRHKVLAYHPHNGVPVCSPRTGRKCHAYADTEIGRGFVHLTVGPEICCLLDKYELTTLKDVLLLVGQSRSEFYNNMAILCKAVIHGHSKH
jgi:hypothetical protein